MAVLGGRKVDHHTSVPAKHYRHVVFMGHLGGVQGGSVCAGETGRSGGWHEHSASIPRVRASAEDNPEDVGVFRAAGLRAEEAGATAEIGSVAGSHRSDSGG